MSGYSDSNGGPPGPKPGALANCATPRIPVMGLQRYAAFLNSQIFQRNFCLSLDIIFNWKNDRSQGNKEVIRLSGGAQGHRLQLCQGGDRGDNGCQRSRKVHAAPDSRNAVHSGFGQSEHRRHGRTLAQGRGAVCLQGKENRLRVPVPPPASGVYCPGECNDACAYCRTGGEDRQEKGRGAPGRARAGGKGGTQALAAFRRRAAEGCHSQGPDQ